MEKGKVEGASIEALNGMADIMHELQLSLEPIRDKALDEKARITGYAQCAEQMLQVIANRVEYLRGMAKDKESEEKEVKAAKKPKTVAKKTTKKPVPEKKMAAAKKVETNE
jgi:chorismate mutase